MVGQVTEHIKVAGECPEATGNNHGWCEPDVVWPRNGKKNMSSKVQQCRVLHFPLWVVLLLFSH
jgi:hypothetical protein